jgi:pyruvate/2-oxoacid:ferredoxin oxidoreductase alpha subunit
LNIQKDIYIYKSRQEKIKIIVKRRTMWKAIKKFVQKKENEKNSDIHGYKGYVLSNEIKKSQEQIPVKRKFERNDTSFHSEEEEDEDSEEIIKELQKNRSKKLFRNIDGENETEHSDADIILVIHKSALTNPQEHAYR